MSPLKTYVTVGFRTDEANAVFYRKAQDDLDIALSHIRSAVEKGSHFISFRIVENVRPIRDNSEQEHDKESQAN